MGFYLPIYHCALFTLIELAERAKLAVFGCLEKYLFTLFCFELRKSRKLHCAIVYFSWYTKTLEPVGVAAHS